MSKLHQLSKLADVLRWLTVAVMFLLPLAIAFSLFTQPMTPVLVASGLAVSASVTQAQMLLTLAVGLISPIILLLTLNEMRKLFVAYSRGEVLTDHCATLIQRIGQGFLALAFTSFFARPIQTLLLTMSNPAGERSIAVGLSSEMVFFALSGGLIIVIGWAMREASDVASENRSFI